MHWDYERLVRSMNRAVDAKTKELGKKFPIEWAYCSKCSLWQRGLEENLVTGEQFEEAQKHYGRLWHYTGD